MKKVFFIIFALMLIFSTQAQNPKSLYLGEKFIPSHLDYHDLARAIDRRLYNMEEVEIVSLRHSWAERWVNFVYRENSVVDLRLRFKAKLSSNGELIQIRCEMGIITFISIFNCRDRKGHHRIQTISNCQDHKDRSQCTDFTIRGLVRRRPFS